MSYEGGAQERDYYPNSNSFQKEYMYDDGETEPFREATSLKTPSKPKILLMGLKRSGKSSIQKVVFHKMSPNETLFLDSTTKITKEDISNSSFVHFQIWDMPGQIDFLDTNYEAEAIFDGCGALIFVIDAQDDYIEAISRLRTTTSKAYKVNPNIKFEVFIHKVDGISDDEKMEKQRDIHSRVAEDVQELNVDVTYSFYLTSIYDHSIFEAFSKVVQKLIPQLPALENLLNILIQNSCIEKAFLFDVNSKIYIATDPYAVDMQSYELCCDMIDLVIDISCIYSNGEDEASSSVIRLTNNTVLYLKQVNRALALVCILREENFEKQGLIDYNFHCFRTGIQQLFSLKEKSDAAAEQASASSAAPQQVKVTVANGYYS